MCSILSASENRNRSLLVNIGGDDAMRRARRRLNRHRPHHSCRCHGHMANQGRGCLPLIVVQLTSPGSDSLRGLMK